MVFTQIEFFIFLAVVFLFVATVKGNETRKIFLLAASWYFYAYWDWRFLGLLLVSITVDYYIGLALERTACAKTRRALLLFSLIFNFGVLGFFKYFNFFVTSLAGMLQPLGLNVSTLSIILPVGISFYTFQSLSYTIDVYSGKLRSCRSFTDYALFVSFFPQLVAGPIVRASDFLPQLETYRALSKVRMIEGGRLLVLGLFKKVFIADHLARYVDVVFSGAGLFDMATTWLAVLAYSIQIFCDFSGYSDMAIGIAKMLGYDFTVNFRMPYLADSISDFWRRWHISLSTWLRDYLYIPLGGSRKGRGRTYFNLMVTMLLGGLWHGAAWTFVFWGGLHGAALVISKHYSLLSGERGLRAERSLAARFAGWAGTMFIVAIGWVFFRSQTFTDAALILRHMFLDSTGIAWYSPFAIGVILAFSAYYLYYVFRPDRASALLFDNIYSPFVLMSMLWLTIMFYPKDFQPFIYFQF